MTSEMNNHITRNHLKIAYFTNNFYYYCFWYNPFSCATILFFFFTCHSHDILFCGFASTPLLVKKPSLFSFRWLENLRIFHGISKFLRLKTVKRDELETINQTCKMVGVVLSPKSCKLGISPGSISPVDGSPLTSSGVSIVFLTAMPFTFSLNPP